MSIRNQNWYNLQSTRRYPLDETSTGDGDDGTTMRDDILVDCHIRFPSTYGEYLYVQGITVSAGLVTVLFGAANNLQAATGVTIATVALPKPVAPSVNYAVTGLIPGVSGWVVFGPGIDTNFVGRYTKPSQSLVAPRCGRPIRALPIPTMGKLGVATSLQGLVTLNAVTPVKVTYKENAGDVVLGANGHIIRQAKQALIFELDQSLANDTYNPLSLFLGPCSQRPESGTCPKTPIESINGVTPDCDGNIEIEFPGFTARDISCGYSCCGVDVLADVSLSETCLAGLPDPQKQFTDICCTPQPNTPVDEYCWADPTPNIDVVIDDPLQFNYTCATLPVCLDFSSCAEPIDMLTASGSFMPVQTEAPDLCNSPNTSGNHFTYAAIGNALNLALFKNCTSDWALNHTIRTQLKISAKGINRNGGLVLNYRQEVGTAALRTTYIVVLLDVNRHRLRVLRYTGSSFIEEHFVTISAKTNTWYTISATPIANENDTVTLEFAAAVLDGSKPTVTGSVTLSQYGTPTGQAGIFTRQSYAYFNQFRID